MPPKKSIQKVSNKVASKGAKNTTSNKKNSKDNTPKPKKTKEQKVNAPSRFINCHHDQHFQQEKDKIPDFVPVPKNDNEDDIAISDDDLEFFADNKTFTSFLTGLDQNELSRYCYIDIAPMQRTNLFYRNTAKKDKKNKIKKAAAPKKEEKDKDNDGLASSSEEEFNSDDDLDNFEEMSDEDLALLEEANVSEDDIDLDDDEEMEQLLAQQQQQQQQQNKKKVVKVDNESDEEMDYEMKPRKVASEWTRKDYHTKLPIKLASGKIHQLDENQDSEDEVEEEEEETPTAAAIPAAEEEQEEEKQEEQPKLSKKEYLIKKKEELALIAGNLQGDPEEYVSQLKTLRTIYRDDNVTVKKLALLTQLAVYKDIIPGYRIRPLTALEEETQVSREVKKMREYEKALLSNYEMYLKDLNVLLSSK